MLEKGKHTYNFANLSNSWTYIINYKERVFLLWPTKLNKQTKKLLVFHYNNSASYSFNGQWNMFCFVLF